MADGSVDDSQLLQQSLAGDSAAFGQLVLKYQDRLYNTLVHVMGSPEDARDITQDAFVQAFVKLESFRGGSAFYTWLYRIAFNLAMSSKRRQRPTVSVDAAREQAGIEPMDRGGEPDEPLMQQERVIQVREALDTLAEDHRAILVLREIEGYCYEEISDILDLPIGTVRSRLHRARSQLRDALRPVLQQELG